VAWQLATSDNYREDAERYRQDRAAEDTRAALERLGLNQAAPGSGADVVEAVNRWVQGVADPYSSNPEKWSRDVRAIMNDPYARSDRLSPESSTLAAAFPVGRAVAATDGSVQPVYTGSNQHRAANGYACSNSSPARFPEPRRDAP
jgi:hypothetical protein